MTGGRRVKVSAPFAIEAEEQETAVRSARQTKDARHIALEIDELVQVHLAPVLHARVGVVGIDAAEVDPRVAHGLQQHARHRIAFVIEHFELRVCGRSEHSGLRLDHQSLALLGIERINIRVHRLGISRHMQKPVHRRGSVQCLCMGRVIVWLLLDAFRQLACQHLHRHAAAIVISIERQRHGALSAGLDRRRLFCEIVPDEMHFRLRIRRCGQRPPAHDIGQRAHR